MSWVDDNKGAGPWDFTEQPDKFGYLNNERWSSQQDAIDFCEANDLPLDLSNQHLPCGHWHKEKVSEAPFPSGKWVAAMQQPGTPFIYVYDILQKAVIQIDTSEIPVFVSGRLELESTYDLDCDMGRGNPGTQRGGYCMNKDGTRIWYLFTKSDGDRSDAELIEVDISKTVMRKIKSTFFLNLVPSEAWPSSVNERINDGCSDDTHTYWPTTLVAGRIIKIRNSDHSIIDDHYFNYTIEGCSGGNFDEPIATIEYNTHNQRLYWVYARDRSGCVPPFSACSHFIRANIDLVHDKEEEVCGSGIHSPSWQNMIRTYANHVFYQRGYHPFGSPLYKRTLDFDKDEMVVGTAFYEWVCAKTHVAAVSNRPTSGPDFDAYWAPWDERLGGNVWQGGQTYHCIRISQQYLQNILGAKSGKIFTLMHTTSVDHPAFLYCIDVSEMEEISKLDISYYTGQIHPPGGYDWDWTSVSALNEQTGVIAIFRYHNEEKRNYAGCFNADSDLGLLCDVPLYSVKHDSGRVISDEPQIWPMPE